MDLGILSLLLSIIGLLVGIPSLILAITAIKYQKPVYYIRNVTFDYKPFQDKVKKLKIFYENESIEKLTISRIIIFNKGNKGISKKNIVKNKPIKIELSPQYKIYEYKTLYNEQEERSELDVDRNYATENILPIKFEYLEPYQGVIIQILHNGDQSNLKISGNIREVKNIEKINDKNNYILINVYIFISSLMITIILPKIYNVISNIFKINETVNAIVCLTFGGVLIMILTLCLLKIKEIPFLTSFFPNDIPSRYLRILNQDWTVE